MACTGLFLCFFLVVHLAGNLLLFAGQQKYDEYAHMVHANKLFLISAEIFLYVAFAAHLYLAFATRAENASARGDVSYAERRSKRTDRVINVAGQTPDSTMFFTGAVVLFFLIVHLCDFKFELFHGTRLDGVGPYEKAGLILGDGFRKLVYLTGSVFLGIHVSHGLVSALQSLGINHPRINRALPMLGIGFALVIALGYVLIVLTAGAAGK